MTCGEGAPAADRERCPVLALLGGALGLLVAHWGLAFLGAFGPDVLQRLGPLKIDPLVLALALGFSLLTGLLVGLIPALQASRAELNEAFTSLDMEDDLDFELGVGVGLLYRLGELPDPFDSSISKTGLGIVAGVGYNLMVDDSNAAWYTFIGFSANFSEPQKK